jgi:hypothetical protein
MMRGWRPSSIALLLGILSMPACADVVRTAAGQVTGEIRLREGGMLVGDKPIGFEQVLFAVREAPPSLSQPQTVCLKSGERWMVECRRLALKKLRVYSPLIGERDLDVAKLAAVDFIVRPAVGAAAASTLYRQEGEGVPGTVLWIDAARLAIETPLGVVTLPREGCLRYVFATETPPAPSPGQDLVTLIDGSIFLGKPKITSAGIELEHELLGAVPLPLSAIRSIQRNRNGVTSIRSATVKQAELIAPAQPEKAVALVDEESGRPWMRSTVLDAKSTARLAMPKDAASFSAVVQGIGQSIVKIRAGDRVLTEKRIARNDPPCLLTADVSGAAEVAIDVDFDGVMKFPCGIILADPLVLGRAGDNR